MVEVEMKFPVADLNDVEKKLVELGARADAPRREEDHYFNAPDRDFARTDEALRMRRIGSANYVTYKGPKRDARTKTRTEIEIAVADGDEAAKSFGQILQHLGYRPVAVVRKKRRIYHLERGGFALEICLDEVEGVGTFAELEIVAEESRVDAARKIVQELADRLGLESSERHSYLELLLATSSPLSPRGRGVGGEGEP